MSPPGADSTLITSAPISANMRVQVGPASARVKSSTRRPVNTCSSGPAITSLLYYRFTASSRAIMHPAASTSIVGSICLGQRRSRTPTRLRFPVVAIETVGQLHKHHTRGAFEHSRQMTLASQIVGYKSLSSARYSLLIVTRTDFDLARQHHHDLTGRRMMPTLIETDRQFDEADARRRPCVGLQDGMTELIGSRLGNWNFDFLKA